MSSSCSVMSPMERVVRRIAGFMILLSVGLGYFVTPWFFILTAMVGANLLQSSFTSWCFVEPILEKMGITR